MQVSEARLAANRRNSALSTGPRSPETRAISARNSLKHGLTGSGVVTPDEDRDELARRIEAFEADMKPTTPAGSVLVHQMAMLSVRADRAAEYETAAIAAKVRHATDDFDEERVDAALELMKGLAEEPRNTLRKLRKSPEGIDVLVAAWVDLRNDLGAEPKPIWTDEQVERAASLIGLNARHALGSRFGDLSRALWAHPAVEQAGDGASLNDENRRERAKSALFEAIDAEIAGLEDHYLTLDFDTIDLDRAEAGSRALFDVSKPACLARRYEADARRGFFKALKEFREVEAESLVRAEVAFEPVPIDQAPTQTAPPVASFREMSPMVGGRPPASLPAWSEAIQSGDRMEDETLLAWVPTDRSPQ